MFSTLSKTGYNTVRVFIIGRNPVNPGIGGDYDTTKALYEPYMENVIDFLRRATQHGIRVFPTFGDGGLPLNAYYRERLNGMLFWTYDCLEQPKLYHAAMDWPLFVRKMGDFEQTAGAVSF